MARRPTASLIAGASLLFPVSALAQTSGGSAAAPKRAMVAPSSSSPSAPAPAATPADPSMKLLEQSVDLIEQEYFDAGIGREELMEAAIRGMVDHLNKRAARAGEPAINAVLSRRDLQRLTESMDGKAIGIGVLAKPAAQGVEVIQVFDGSAADKAGIQRGDRITAVDGTTLEDATDLFSLLRGEEGSQVRVAVLRPDGDHASSLQFDLVRSRYKVAPVHCELIGDDVGYIEIDTLSRGAADEVRDCLLDTFHNVARGIILDLRGNPGGSLDEATEVASMFVEPGKPLLQIRVREGDPQVIAANAEVLWPSPQPVIAIVDGGTSSAAEALASALQTANRAALIGERTAGRALGESIFALSNGGALRLGTARYESAIGETWAGRGLTPNIPVSSASLDPQADPLLESAVTALSISRPAPLGPIVHNGPGANADYQPLRK
jgi:carboxyl-terminal processing protease